MTELLEYKLAILMTMVNELDEPNRSIISQQVTAVTEEITDVLNIFRQKSINFTTQLRQLVDDVTLQTLMQQFDLEATKREKEELKKKLDDDR